MENFLKAFQGQSHRAGLFEHAHDRAQIDRVPGSGGNSTFGDLDMDNYMRPVFYTAVIGWILIGCWIATLRYRVRIIEDKRNSF